jgi:RNA polymerase sigma-70 factor, ECF subfamily
MTSEALMAAFQKGDAKAFSELMARHERPLWNFLRRFVAVESQAEDLLQETFLRVIRHAGDWQPSAKFSTWLYTIARNLCTDQARRMSLRKAASLDAPAGPATTDGASADGDGTGPRRIDRLSGGDRGGEVAAQNRQAADRIEQAVAELPHDQREVFLMREVMDMSFAEIAAAVGASEPTVKSRMRYALGRLRQALDDLRDSGAHPTIGSKLEQAT